ncbi:AAA family ATPase [Paracoccus bogoriensis]|uniref:ATP-dependent nuclease n=1 Tax=Paracoccus bogoriensis TaxID=242065 RepID=UPI001CA4DA01|nr:AAA family ATPase [Paracoccus bogoriensis]MBW7057389.1 AAA family ATPase [Paracoccus bogoriensis]
MRHESNFPRQEAMTDQSARTESKGLTLLRYRVSNFRSVTDSGWLSADHVTALIGVNESGKTNLLLPLWKLNPASGGELQPTSDYPKTLFAAIRAAPGQFPFVTAEFDTGTQAETLAALAGVSVEQARRVSVSRCYDGSYQAALPAAIRDEGKALRLAVEALRDTLKALKAVPAGTDLRAEALELVGRLLTEIDGPARVTGNDLRLARNAVGALIPAMPPASSLVIPHLRALQKTLGQQMAAMMSPDPASRDEVRQWIIDHLPRFVYYSNYGNLDSEIYLPHVVENMGRADLGAKEAAKARTLRVLFDFVGLQASEILELGRDFRDLREDAERRQIAEEGHKARIRTLWQRARGENDAPDADLLARIAEAKRTRSILLQSAGTKLTERFGEWWLQGDYRFRFEADGNHFRIWVSDSRRPQEVELEHRSTGLQWFLSFFLVFLHEARGRHENCVLLLDEPGHSLHPLAQRDLSAFFEALAERNQIIYTTHSPFLIDADRLARARKVYVDRDGSTRASSDLLEGEGRDSQRGAAFVVRAALNLAVAEATLGGAQPVLVQGQVEQTYLSLIRTLCIASGRFRPRRDLIFAPVCGLGVMPVLARMLGGADARPPSLVVDGTTAGAELAAAMAVADAKRLVRLDDISGREVETIEDLLPKARLAALLDRIERRPERMFSDVLIQSRPFMPQVLEWARDEGITLAPDWRLRLAERLRTHLLDGAASDETQPLLEPWLDLMTRLQEG